MISVAACLALLLASVASYDRTCSDGDFPLDLGRLQYLGLKAAKSANTVSACRQACCDAEACDIYQYSITRLNMSNVGA